MSYDYITRINMLPRMAVTRYQPPTPAHWDLSKLQKKWYWRGIHWLLNRLGGAYLDMVPESYPVKTVEIDQRDIQTIIGQSQRAMRLLWNKQATTLIIGPEEFVRFKRELPLEMFSFNAEWPLGNSGQFKMAGLRVVVVPWLSGWTLLPDLNEG
jgi:hypothetical protein